MKFHLPSPAVTEVGALFFAVTLNEPEEVAMDNDLTDEDWLKAMRLISPERHSEEYLRLAAKQFNYSLEEFVKEIADYLKKLNSTQGVSWGWAVVNDRELMEHYDQYTLFLIR